MKSRVAHINHGSSYERKESHSSCRRSSSPEDRYAERERSWSPRDRGYSDHSKYDQEYSGKGRDDKTVEARGWRRETPQEKGRERESDRRKQKKFPSPDRKSPERSVPQSSLGHDEPPSKKRKEELDPILTRTGGAYIPPAKLRMMQEQITDKNSLAYQRMSWEALKKSINGLVNKVNVSNIENIIHELLQENIVRGRGLLSRSILQAQSASPIFTHVYAAVVAIINSKFPNIGELILKRLILNFRKGYRRNDKQLCLTASKFVAHLINQNVAHEVLCLEMLTLLLERPTDDSIEVAIGFLKECGLKLTEVSPRGINAIFDRLRHVLHESKIDMRVQYMIEVMFAVRKDGFKDHPIIPEGLDLVEEEDQFTHMLPLEDDYNPEDVLNVFKMDPDFMENEEKYKTLKKEILDEGDSDSETDQDAGSSEEDEEEDEEDEEGQKVTIHDQTEINLVSFRRTIYLAIQSSLDFEECAHKLLKMDFPDSQTKELCNMILDCCAQQRTYEKFFGLLAGRFCMLKKEYMESFEAIFKEQYDTIHRLETNKLRNVAKMFAHLLYTDSLPWSVLECIILSEETTTSSSRIFVKIFFQELSEYMGLPNLNARLKDETLQSFFEGLLPRDNPRNTRFAINFFTSIGLGGLTDELREHLKNAPKMIMTQKQDVESSDSSSSSSESDSSSDSNPDSSNSSSGSSSGRDSSSSSGHSSVSDAAQVKRKKMQKKNKALDKVARKKQGSKKKLIEKKIERRQQEGRYDVERDSERNADRNLRDPNRRDDLSKYPYDRDDATDRNSYRSGKDWYYERNMDLENKHSNSKKKKAERRTSFSDNEKDKHWSKDNVHQSRRKERSKSRERNRNNSSPREEEEQENRYRNGAEKRPEKYSRYSDQSRESRKNEDRRRENSPHRRK
ncbi:pre-mRNA-splicing factor CWC22 homolog [Chelonia mydas]|uniref:pre-mRNA-splicing factor CWC22 homolog n=1 Tax=Chelonia mydas TaxID=8469 RepID=UPI0018A1FF3E|nr:pre-mRNA-splicing factor CWC22 homolog [Chelonia mydas]XP_037767995.1 pre-mRNA-splicing factor CWC22 homolog [Chelonia mydas]XP_043381776.1 pre-mRNA-splicing factor CWC22 homolog [Chelonia mydas]XP_043381777.1 pre-mRNA-splicing factor CWC22 homolog [Chelonia mydas]XP_043381778.1 pre-mRNA-splicing factor CWC22 homolog [Chelonia mydas]